MVKSFKAMNPGLWTYLPKFKNELEKLLQGEKPDSEVLDKIISCAQTRK